MSARKQGNNKRPPRTSGPVSPCISIMPDGTAKNFTPKKSSSTGYAIVDGKIIPAIKERELR